MMLTSADRGGELARCRELGIAVYLPPARSSSPRLLNAVLTAMGGLRGGSGYGSRRLASPGVAPAAVSASSSWRITSSTRSWRPTC